MPKLKVLVLLTAIALMLATFGAGWKWGKGTHAVAGSTWDEDTASLVSVDT